MENYGFVYIWLDRKHKRYYIGSHWGTENDGYVCSSTWMNRAYKRRPNDFKRKIIRKFIDRKEMLQEERRIINMINPSEIGVKYYNLRLGASDGWHTFDDEKKLTVAQRISFVKKSNFDKKRKQTGQAFSNEHIKKLSQSKLGIALQEEHKVKIGESGKKTYENGRVGYWSNHEFTEEHRKKLSEAAKTRIPVQEKTKSLMAKSNSKKYRIIRDGSEHVIHGLKSYGKSEGIPYVSLFKAAQTGGPLQKYGISSICVIS